MRSQCNQSHAWTHKVLLRAAGAADKTVNAHCLGWFEEMAIQHQGCANGTFIYGLCNVGQLGIAELQGQQSGLASPAVCQAAIGYNDVCFLGPLCIPAPQVTCSETTDDQKHMEHRESTHALL